MPPANLAIPSYRQGIQPLVMDLEPCFVAERRLFEISFADKQRAKDLFSEFVRAYVYASKLHAMVKMHVAKAAIESRRRRSVLLLDHIPEMAKTKGLSTSRNATGSEDVREAFYYADATFVAIEDSRAALEATEALLFGKMMAFRDASDAVKSMLAPEDRPRLNNATIEPNAHGKDDVPNPMQQTPDEVPPVTDVAGFGTPGH